MRRAEDSARSSFFSAIGRFPAGGFAASAIAILVGSIEAWSVRAPELPPSDTATPDKPAPDSLADAASKHAPLASQASDGGVPSKEAASGHSLDGALSTAASSTHSDGDDGYAHGLGDGDGFRFDAQGNVHQGQVHLSLGAEDSAHSASGGFAPPADDASADMSAPLAHVAFTGAESSSFQYSGPSILDTEPGGAQAHPADAVDAVGVTMSIANGAIDGSEINGPSSATNLENNLPIFGGANLKAGIESAAPTVSGSPATASGSGTTLSVWSGDIGNGFTNADSGGGTTSGTSDNGAGGGQGGGSGLVINVVYDASVASAPAGFTQAVAAVVAFYESEFSNPVTITIDVGYGEIDGQAVEPGALGESEAYLTSVSYAQLQAALANNANNIGDTAAAESLLATSPVNGQYWVTTAEAKALGIISSASVSLDGYAGFSNIPTIFDYSVGNDSGTVPGYQYDFFGTVAHEFSEVMGRQMMDGADFVGAAGYEPLDLFHYSAPGVRDFSGTTAGYISPNGGVTNLDNLNTNPNGDFGDWAASAGNDSYQAYSNPGTLNPVTASDITVMNLLGWDTAPPPPVVTATPVHAYDVLGGTVAVAPAQAANGGVLADDSDTASGAVLNVSAVDGSTANVGVGVAGIFGVLTLDADGSYSYVNNNPGGVSVAGGVVEDSFNFTVSDGQGDTANSTLTVLIASPSNDYMTGPQGSTIEAGKGPTVLDGSAGDMNVYAGPGGHQWLVGGPGDTMVGASDRDAFVFTPSFGNETIENFHPRDVIEFPESLFANFTAVKADMESSGANTVITVDANDAITLTNFTPAQLHAHNFHFIV